MEKDTPHQHLYGTRSKTQTNAVIQALNIGDDSMADTGFESLVSSMSLFKNMTDIVLV